MISNLQFMLFKAHCSHYIIGSSGQRDYYFHFPPDEGYLVQEFVMQQPQNDIRIWAARSQCCVPSTSTLPYYVLLKIIHVFINNNIGKHYNKIHSKYFCTLLKKSSHKDTMCQVLYQC